MSERQSTGPLDGVGVMLISAAIFAFFGWFMGMNWNSPGVDGNPVLFRILLGWTLKGSAIAFVAAAGLTMVNRVAGNALYALAGIIGTFLFLVVAAMDFLDKQHGSFHAYAPAILVVFAIWNGYGSWNSLSTLMAARRGARPDALPDPEDRDGR